MWGPDMYMKMTLVPKGIRAIHLSYGAGDGNRTRVISLEVLRLFALSRLPAKTRSPYLLFLCLLRLKRLCFIVQSTQVVTRLLHGVLHGNEGGTHGTNWGNVQLLFSFSLR